MIDLKSYTGSVAIIKLVTGEHVISEVKNIDEIKAIQLIFPLEFEMDWKDETTFDIYFKRYLEGSETDTCFVSKGHLVTAYPPSMEVLEQYLNVFEKVHLDDEDDGALIDEDDDMDGFNFRAGNIQP